MSLPLSRVNIPWRRVASLSLAVLTVCMSFFVVGPVAHVKASSSPDFSVSDDASSLDIPLGNSQWSDVTVTSANGFSGQINLVASASSSAFKCTFTLYNTLTVGVAAGGTNTVALLCSAGTPAGSYSLTITGSSGSLTHSIVLPVSVTDFSLSGPTTVSLNAGSMRSETITVSSLYSLSGRIPLKISAQQGLSASCPSSVTLSPNATVTVACVLASPTAGAYNVTLAGSFVCDLCTGTQVTPVIRSQATSVTVSGPSVPGFDISSNGVSVTTGYPNVAEVTLTSVNGFSGTVALSTTPPQGIAASVSPTTVNLGAGGTANATMSVVSTNCELGNHSVMFTGTSGSQPYFTSVPVTVAPQNPMQDEGYGYYVVCASPISIYMPQGPVGNATVVVVSANGGLGTYDVDLTAGPNPATSLINCQTSPSILHFASTITALNSTLSCTSSTPGNYTVTVTASWPNPFHCNSPSCIPPPDPATSISRVSYIVGNSSVTIDHTANFQGVSVTTSGSVSNNSGKLSGTISIMATNSSTGALLFSKAYTVSNLVITGNSSRFLLNVGVNPDPLSADIMVTQAGGVWSANVIITKQLDIAARGTVDIVDVGIILSAFDSYPGSPLYNSRADVGARGSIDIVDVGMLFFFYGAPNYT
jgi:hypothetical protein